MKTLLSLAFLFLLVSCASQEQRYISRYCHPEGAYKKGYNDAQSGLTMSNHIADLCLGYQSKARVRKAYREGYRSFAQCQTETKDSNNGPIICH